MDLLSVEETANDIRIAIIQAYMQCLYAAETVTVSRSTAEASKVQRDRAEEMWKAGSISRVDFAQLESQWKSDEYQVVSAQASYDEYLLQLKQLLGLRCRRTVFCRYFPLSPTSIWLLLTPCLRLSVAIYPYRRPSWRYVRPAQDSFRPFLSRQEWVPVS